MELDIVDDSGEHRARTSPTLSEMFVGGEPATATLAQHAGPTVPVQVAAERSSIDVEPEPLHRRHRLDPQSWWQLAAERAIRDGALGGESAARSKQ